MWLQKLWHWVFPFPGLGRAYRHMWIRNRKQRRVHRSVCGYHPEEGD